MSYRIISAQIVQRVSDGAFIPNDPLNIDRAAYEAWLATGGLAEPMAPAPTPPPRRVISVLEFRDRLTPAEEIAITQAGMASAAVRVWLDRLSGAQEVNLDDPRTVAGLHAMAAAGLLATERVTEILA